MPISEKARDLMRTFYTEDEIDMQFGVFKDAELRNQPDARLTQIEEETGFSVQQKNTETTSDIFTNLLDAIRCCKEKAFKEYTIYRIWFNNQLLWEENGRLLHRQAKRI